MVESTSDIILKQEIAVVDQRFLSAAFAETKDQPLVKRDFQGKFFNPFNSILKEAATKLHEIKEDLPTGVLLPRNDMGKTNYQIYLSLSPDTQAEVDTIREKKDDELTKLSQQNIVPKLQKQTIPQGVLDIPPHYYPQESSRTCVTANFRMIFEALTGRTLEETTLLDAARTQGLINEGQIAGELLPEETLLKLFQADKFKEHFPETIARVIDLDSADFEDISELVSGLKAKAPSLQAYCMARIGSEVFEEGWHSVLLLSADEQNVVVHDPSNKVGGASKRISKPDFAQRWGKAFLGSYLVLATK